MKCFPILASIGLTAFFAACTVEEKSDDCEAGVEMTCHCGDAEGIKVCDNDGNGYGACDCGDDGTGGKSGTGGKGSGGGDEAGGKTSAGGKTGSGGGGYGGDYTAPDAGDAGPDGAVAPADGGPDAQPEAGSGDGGDGGAVDFTEACLACAEAVCPDELTACLDDESCFNETTQEGDAVCMLDCIALDREASTNGTLTTTDQVQACGEDTCGNAGWPGGVTATAGDLFNCLANNPEFPSTPAWQAPNANNCTRQCFGAGGG